MKKAFAQVLADYPAGTNKRWIAHHTLLGRMPEGFEFTMWILDSWQEFAEICGVGKASSLTHSTQYSAYARVCLKMGEKEAIRAFDAWLIKKVERANEEHKVDVIFETAPCKSFSGKITDIGGKDEH